LSSNEKHLSCPVCIKTRKCIRFYFELGLLLSNKYERINVKPYNQRFHTYIRERERERERERGPEEGCPSSCLPSLLPSFRAPFTQNWAIKHNIHS